MNYKNLIHGHMGSLEQPPRILLPKVIRDVVSCTYSAFMAETRTKSLDTFVASIVELLREKCLSLDVSYLFVPFLGIIPIR